MSELRRRKATIFDNVQPELYKYLFPGDFFDSKPTKAEMADYKEKVKREMEEDRIAAEEAERTKYDNDFYMKKVMEQPWYDRLERDAYGNYYTDTYYYQKMQEHDFPLGDDEMPEIWNGEEFYD